MESNPSAECFIHAIETLFDPHHELSYLDIHRAITLAIEIQKIVDEHNKQEQK